MKNLFTKNAKISPRKSSPFFNSEGYADPTAFHGTKNIIKEETEMEDKVHSLVHVIRDIANLSGFEVIGRIQFRHKKSGREFK
jgi:hypothetical protein